MGICKKTFLSVWSHRKELYWIVFLFIIWHELSLMNDNLDSISSSVFDLQFNQNVHLNNIGRKLDSLEIIESILNESRR